MARPKRPIEPARDRLRTEFSGYSDFEKLRVAMGFLSRFLLALEDDKSGRPKESLNSAEGVFVKDVIKSFEVYWKEERRRGVEDYLSFLVDELTGILKRVRKGEYTAADANGRVSRLLELWEAFPFSEGEKNKLMVERLRKVRGFQSGNKEKVLKALQRIIEMSRTQFYRIQNSTSKRDFRIEMDRFTSIFCPRDLKMRLNVLLQLDRAMQPVDPRKKTVFKMPTTPEEIVSVTMQYAPITPITPTESR